MCDILESIKSDINLLNKKLALEYSTKSDIDIDLQNFSINNFEEDLSNLIKICKRSDITCDILKYILNNHKVYEATIDNLEDTIELIKQVLKIFHRKVGGEKFEDCTWNYHDNSSKMFKLDDQTILFSNSIDEKFIDDFDTDLFILNVTDYIKQYLKSNIKLIYKKMYDDRRDIIWTCIIVKNLDS